MARAPAVRPCAGGQRTSPTARRGRSSEPSSSNVGRSRPQDRSLDPSPGTPRRRSAVRHATRGASPQIRAPRAPWRSRGTRRARSPPRSGATSQHRFDLRAVLPNAQIGCRLRKPRAKRIRERFAIAPRVRDEEPGLARHAWGSDVSGRRRIRNTAELTRRGVSRFLRLRLQLR